MTRNPRWINNYRLQYWLYAVLKNALGTEVKMERDSLHSRYSVNRHGFYVRTNSMALVAARRAFISKLDKAGYKIDPSSTASSVTMVKETTREHKIERQYISIYGIQDGKFHVNGRSYLG
jgi:hypothetical protein